MVNQNLINWVELQILLYIVSLVEHTFHRKLFMFYFIRKQCSDSNKFCWFNLKLGKEQFLSNLIFIRCNPKTLYSGVKSLSTYISFKLWNILIELRQDCYFFVNEIHKTHESFITKYCTMICKVSFILWF